MSRLVLGAGGAAALLALAACGSAPANTSSNSNSNAKSGTQGSGQNAGPGGLRRNGAAGEVAQLNGTSLILNTATGDVTVDYGATTPITQTKTGVLADIVSGTCLVATGTKDATGTLVASGVQLSQPQNGACTLGTRIGNRPPGAGGNGTGTPRRTPPAGAANFSFAAGKVTAVNGTSITLQPATGAAQTITVPTTVTVAESSAASASDLAVGDCVSANGSKDSSGTVTATSMQIVPAGPSGCFTGGRGFGGGFGGRFFGGGGGGGTGGTGADGGQASGA